MQAQSIDVLDVTQNPLLVDGLIVGKTARGRSIYSASSKADVARLFKDSVASASHIAIVNGINENLVSKWARLSNVCHKKKGDVSTAKPQLIAVQVKREFSNLVEHSFVRDKQSLNCFCKRCGDKMNA